MVGAAFLQELLSVGEPADSLVGRLLQAANYGGGTDNITAIVIKIQESGVSSQESGLLPG
jgi:serine/threonine protein phosphatase PrpC